MRNKQKSQVTSSFPFPQASWLSCLDFFLTLSELLSNSLLSLFPSQNALTSHPPAAWPTHPGRSPVNLWWPILRPAASAPKMVLCKCQSPCPSLGGQRTQESEWGGKVDITWLFWGGILRKPHPLGGPSVHVRQRERPLRLFTEVKWGLQGAREVLLKSRGERGEREEKRWLWVISINHSEKDRKSLRVGGWFLD